MRFKLKRIASAVIALALSACCTAGSLANVDENNLGGADGYTYVGGWSGVNNNEAWANNADTMWKVTVYAAKTDKVTNSSAYSLTDDYYKFGETFWLYANGRGIANISDKSKLLIETGCKEEYVHGGKTFEEKLFSAVSDRFFKYEDYFSSGSLPKVNNFGADSVEETRAFFEGNRAASNRFVELAAKAAGTTPEKILSSLEFTINGTAKTGWDLPMVDLRCSSDSVNDHSSCISWVFLYEPVIIINNTLNSGYCHALTATGIAKSTLAGRYNFAHDTWSYRIVFKNSGDIPAVQAQYWRWGTGFAFKSMPNSAYLSSNWLGYRSGDSYTKVTDSKYWYVEDQLEGGGFGLRYQRSELPKVVIQKTIEGEAAGDLSGFSITVTSDSTGNTWSGTTTADGKLAFYLAPGTYTITEADCEGYRHHDAQKFTVPKAVTSGSVIYVDFDNKKDETGAICIEKYADDGDFSDVSFEIYEDGEKIAAEPKTAVKTDGDGKTYLEVLFENLPAGDYTVTEKCPSRYAEVLSGNDAASAIKSSELSVTVAADITTHCYFRNVTAKTVTVRKTVDGASSGDLSGFEFTVTDNSSGEKTTAKTGKSGTASFTLVPGSYTLSESRKAGYEETADVTFTVSADSEDTIYIDFDNKKLATAGNLVLSKMCDIGGSFVIMEDLSFKITAEDGGSITISPFGSFLARKVGTITTGGNTYEVRIESFKSSNETLEYAEQSAGETLTLSDGSTHAAKGLQYQVTISGLPEGRYTIEENDGSLWEKTAISVDFGVMEETTAASFEMSGSKDTYVHIENYENSAGALKITKTSDDANVSGITFYVNGNPYVTDENGEIVLYGITPGDYTVSEVNPDSGRYVSEDAKTVTVPWYGIGGVTFHNTVRRKLTVNYYDVYTGEKIHESYVKYFDGADEYDVTDMILAPGEAAAGYTVFSRMDGDSVTGVMDRDREVNVYYGYTHRVTVNYYDVFTGNVIMSSYVSGALEHGSYYSVKDHVNLLADGYSYIDSVTGNSPSGTLDSDKVINVYEGYDDGSGEAELTKVSENGTLLKGAVFTLYKNDGTVVASGLTTDENGTIHCSGLSFGTYYFIETSAPDGFSVNTERQFFVIDASCRGTVNKITVTDSPKSRSITLIKRIKISDIVFAHGDPVFIFTITSGDSYRQGAVTVSSDSLAAYLSENPGSLWIELPVTFTDLPAGIWTAKEEKTLRYTLAENGIEARKGTVTVSKTTADCDLTAAGAEAVVAFTNDKTDQSGTSNTALTVNIFKTGRKLSKITCVWSGGSSLTLPAPDPNDLTVTAYYDDGSVKVLGGDEYVLEPGLLTAADNGNKVIKVSYTDGGISKYDTFMVNVQIPEDYFTWEVTDGTAFYDDDGTYYDGCAKITGHYGPSAEYVIPTAVTGIRLSGTEYVNNGKVYKVTES